MHTHIVFNSTTPCPLSSEITVLLETPTCEHLMSTAPHARILQYVHVNRNKDANYIIATMLRSRDSRQRLILFANPAATATVVPVQPKKLSRKKRAAKRAEEKAAQEDGRQLCGTSAIFTVYTDPWFLVLFVFNAFSHSVLAIAVVYSSTLSI